MNTKTAEIKTKNDYEIGRFSDSEILMAKLLRYVINLSKSEHANTQRILDRLNELSLLKTNWDGYGAMPIFKKIIKTVKNLLPMSEDKDWQNWLVSPNVNATLTFQSEKNRASISLGEKEYSYYAVLNGKRLGESHIDFDAQKFLSLMRKLDQ